MKEQFKMALDQLKEYSDNELVIVGDKSFNIEETVSELEKSKENLLCPKCGSKRIRLTDMSPLYIPDQPKDIEEWEKNSKGKVDDLMHVMYTCQDCKHNGTMEGYIHWHWIS